MWLCVEVLIILASITIGFISYFKWLLTYWKRKDFPYLEPTFPFGNIENPFKPKCHFGLQLKRMYEEFQKQGHKHGGFYIFWSPCYVVIDPDYIKNILTKDYEYFIDHGFYYNEKDDPLSAHLLNLTGQKWKNLRAKFTPAFTPGKMKMMFSTLVECGDQLTLAVEALCGNNKPIDIKDILSCFTTDVIGSCAFGLECNSFVNPNNEFRKHEKYLFSSPRFLKRMRKLIITLSQDFARFLKIKVIDRRVSNFFLGIVTETIEYRKKTSFKRNDFMQILIDLQNDDGTILTVEQIAAQAILFFLAGSETSSTVMTFCLYELSRHQHIQQRLKKEINEVLEKHEGKITYDSITEMKYLDQVLNETLRKYPPGSSLQRVCVKDYKIPNTTDLTIEKGTTVFVPVYALHMDPKYFPDPEKFDPQRFNDENKKVLPQYVFVPFGDGPRNCIGLRFGIMQSKVGLVKLLRYFEFTVNQRTNTPFEMDPNRAILIPKDRIWLNCSKV